jgi:hypothetical protein
MTKGDKTRNDRFLDALVEELRAMSDTDALEGEKPEELVKLGERLLKDAREEAGKLRMADAKRKLAAVPGQPVSVAQPSAAEARKYLQSIPKLTLAARNLDELSDADVLDLFWQVKCLEDHPGSGTEENSE